MWQEEEIVWQQTNHAWDDFGIETSLSFDDDPVYAKVLAIWKKQTLGELVKNITTAVASLCGFIKDQNLATSLTLALAGANLFPVHLKFVKEDAQADKFLDILHMDEEGEQYFLRSELETVGDLSEIINYFVEQELLAEKGERLIVQGKVLKRAHIKLMLP